MSRKPVLRSLPPLAAVDPAFAGFGPTEHKLRRLATVLRQAARQVRRTRPQVFYAMSVVAGFYGVSLHTVAAAYRRLEQEGLLSRERGAKTVVRPLRLHSRTPVHAIVGLPIYLPGFLEASDLRLFFIRFEEQLRRHDCAAVFIFYEQGEDIRPDFARRVLAHKPDYVVWLTPVPVDRPVIAAIRDGGVLPLVLWPSYRAVADQKYVVSKARALEQGLAAWRRDGITAVRLPRREERTAVVEPDLEHALRASGLRYSLATLGERSLVTYLGELGRGRHVGVIFDDDFWLSRLCRWMPGAVADMLRQTRCLVLRPVNLAPMSVAGARLDVVEMDWIHVARRLATDLAQERLFSPPARVLFEAHWRPRVPAELVAAGPDDRSLPRDLLPAGAPKRTTAR